VGRVRSVANHTKSSDLLDIMPCTNRAVKPGLTRDLVIIFIYLKRNCLR